MKKEIIIFKDEKPSKSEACKSIEHFCRDHSMTYKRLTRKWPVQYDIDGELYSAEIQEETLEQPGYWMVRASVL